MCEKNSSQPPATQQKLTCGLGSTRPLAAAAAAAAACFATAAACHATDAARACAPSLSLTHRSYAARHALYSLFFLTGPFLNEATISAMVVGSGYLTLPARRSMSPNAGSHFLSHVARRSFSSSTCE